MHWKDNEACAFEFVKSNVCKRESTANMKQEKNEIREGRGSSNKGEMKEMRDKR